MAAILSDESPREVAHPVSTVKAVSSEAQQMDKVVVFMSVMLRHTAEFGFSRVGLGTTPIRDLRRQRATDGQGMLKA